MPTAPVLVTRPEAAGSALAARLAQAGLDALWLPAFDLGPAPEPQRVARVLAELAAFDLVVFVSPAAVRAAAALLPQPWPRQTVPAAVGAATAAALRGLPALQDVRIIEPRAADATAEGEAESGSEALWLALEPILRSGDAMKRALLLRAQHGREWLVQRLREAGAEAQTLAVYTRLPHPVAGQETAWVQQRQGAPIDSLFSSSEAVEALTMQLAGLPQARDALKAGRALASHPRIAERLSACGFVDVRVCPLHPEAIVTALRRG